MLACLLAAACVSVQRFKSGFLRIPYGLKDRRRVDKARQEAIILSNSLFVDLIFVLFLILIISIINTQLIVLY